MNFAPTEDQLAVQATARDFAQQEVLPKAAAIDREHRHPTELVQRMAELGFLGIAVPEEWGGSGLDNVSYALAMEEISRACASTGVIMSVNNSLVCDPIYRFGTDAQKERWLKPLAAGQLLGCFALSEPEAGSDAAAQRTTATQDGDGWVLQGTKNWITNGPVADACVLFAMNDKALGHKGITAFILPMKTAGVRTGAPDDKLGIRGSKSSQIHLDDARLPAEALLGERNRGFEYMMERLPQERLSVAVANVAHAAAALEETLVYVKERQAFGQAIGTFQHSRFLLAEMQTQVDAARAFVDQCVMAHVAGELTAVDAAKAKWWTAELQNEILDHCVQLFGGYGFIDEYRVARFWADGRVSKIWGGTNEIMKDLIGRSMGLS